MSEWRPIETAPRDGTRILGYGPAGFELKPVFAVLEWLPSSEKWAVFPNEATEYDYEACRPIYWMPLPAPPES